MSRSVENGAGMEGGDEKSQGVQCRGDRHMGLSRQTHGAERRQCGRRAPLSLLQQSISCLLS